MGSENNDDCMPELSTEIGSKWFSIEIVVNIEGSNQPKIYRDMVLWRRKNDWKQWETRRRWEEEEWNKYISKDRFRRKKRRFFGRVQVNELGSEWELEPFWNPSTSWLQSIHVLEKEEAPMLRVWVHRSVSACSVMSYELAETTDVGIHQKVL